MAGARSSLFTGFVVLTATYHTAPAPAPPPAPAPSGSRFTELAAPAPLDAEEAAGPDALALARRFNPAMAFPLPDIWPVEVRYAWHDGADLVAQVDGGGPAQSYVAVPGSSLDHVDWSDLPHRTAEGRAIRYFVDAPGDDRLVGPDGLSRWRKRWREIVQPRGLEVSPAASVYPPTQYAHVYWWNRAQGLIAISYWFYYPFNEWVNHHEGDWERIQVILRGPARLTSGASFLPVGHQFFFHERFSEPEQFVRLAGREGRDDPPEDHPLVYVGGRGRFLAWSGIFSGASYPLPARYQDAAWRIGPFGPDEEIAAPARFIAPHEFRIILLPEPARLDARRSPELSWLRLPFYAGQRAMHINPPGYRVLEQDGPPLQPAARAGWLGPPEEDRWTGQLLPAPESGKAARWPRAWTCARPLDPQSCPTASSSPFAALGPGVPAHSRVY